MTTSQRPRSSSKRSLWVCPTCQRRFAKANQWHSCKETSVDSHFVGKDPQLRDLLDLLVEGLKRTGPLRINSVKSSINLVSRHHFGGVKVRRNYLRIGFLATSAIKDSRIVHRQVVGPERIGHEIIVRSARDLEPEVLEWLAQAQQLQA